ncbi:MAG: 50S ribosomal protein L21 [Bacteroidetes bacterium MED-G17]|nr:MAG: 50S ribosomal protein L21 [Bacteroidetes bacterium TMED39]PDH52031.1 MAG: 50S ribosomal protein L21 [Bacteroidetes bacterium MED-G17]CAI8273637.1 MAG: 50S ribosomal protein L21 [Bacteroidetes bacterium MED-G17]|tara:strand:+ start:261 stop:575 length:315 start_codon:yes stop_codon:yes gene_type:complete
MFAIVDIQGQQFKVEKDQELYVHRMNEQAEGDSITLNDVLLVDNNGKVKIGTPKVKGASISAKVLEHTKGDKIIVFKKKRRKGYKVKNGHRQQFTKIQIEEINA